MIQLSYQAAFDPFHTVFRLLRLRASLLKEGSLERDQLRILDFYLLFPFLTDSIRVFSRHRSFKKLASRYEAFRPYGDLPDNRLLFGRMGPIQGAALDTLVEKGWLDTIAYSRGVIARSQIDPPPALATKIASLNEEQADLIEFLQALGREYALLGSDGLKDRTGLMDYRYDAT